MRPFMSTHSSERVYDMFVLAANVSPDYLERVKHIVAEKDRDYTDLTDLISILQPETALKLLRLFVTAAPNVTPKDYGTIVLSDIDNTSFENRSIAPCIYRNHHLIPGFVSLIRAIRGLTTVTFITARPSELERSSICSKNDQLLEAGIREFSMKSGSIGGTVHYALYMALRASLKRSTRSYWIRRAQLSAIAYSERKIEAYLELKRAFPAARRFVFFGDDTQGDYLTSIFIARDMPTNACFVRMVSPSDMSMSPKSHLWREDWPQTDPPNLVRFTSYFDLIVNHAHIFGKRVHDMAKSNAIAEAKTTYAQDMHRYANVNAVMRNDANALASLEVSLTPSRQWQPSRLDAATAWARR